MGKRSTGRKLAMQLLYQSAIQHGKSEDIGVIFEEHSIYHEDTKKWALNLFEEAIKVQIDCDKLIVKYAIGWELSRINAIDKSILRLAFYELLFTDTHFNIVLNEAIELAKRYSTEESPKFINGILGTYVKETCSQESSKS
jgi:transcription antitermination protein NusB